ncbi:MAG: hypothetical protein K2R98_05970 [Gemmataceae bacterium]|nr:hypothetical protein [Gemmataceae bacterium]
MAELNPKKSTLHCELVFEGAWPTSVAFLGSGRKLAAGNRDGVLLVWDLPAEPSKDAILPVRKLEGHTNAINRLVATDDGKLLISASHDKTVRVWDPNVESAGSAELIIDAEQREREAKKNPKGDALSKPGVKVATQTAQHVFTGHRDWVQALGLSRDQKRLISGDDSGLVQIWDLASRKEVAKWTGNPGNWITSACLSPDGQTAFVAEFCAPRGSFDRPPAQVRLFDVTTGKETLDFLKVLYPNIKVRDNSYGYATTWGQFVAQGLVAAEFSPDGKLLALAQGGETGTGKVHLMDVATGKLVRGISGHQSGACDATFSADGQYVLSVGRDTLLRICQVADGKEVAQLGKSRGGQFKDWLHAVALSPDQQWLAAADISGRVLVWKMG